MDTSGKNFDILSGPDRGALIGAFESAYDRRADKPEIKFEIALSYTVANDVLDSHRIKISYYPMKTKDYLIASIKHDDTSGKSFEICGYCMADIRCSQDPVIYKQHRFTAFYNTDTKKGYITFFT